MELIVFLIVCIIGLLFYGAVIVAEGLIMAAFVAIVLMIMLIGFIIKKIQEHERKMSDTQFYTVISLSILGIILVSSAYITCCVL